MSLGRLILVETSMAGNLGAAIRVAANFAVPRLDLVRCAVPEGDGDVRSWACGGEQRLEIRRHQTLDQAVVGVRTLVATASARGRGRQPVIEPRELVQVLRSRGIEDTALMFGNETSGLCRDHLDRCDLVVRVPTAQGFPVLNLTQAIAILLGYLSIEHEPSPGQSPVPAPEDAVRGLMLHLSSTLLDIGFLDPANPDRILRKLRRILGRAGVTSDEVTILRGICRQVDWASRTGCGRWSGHDDGPQALSKAASDSEDEDRR